MSGTLTEVPVKEGQAVKKGDVLFKMFSKLAQAKLDSAKAELDAKIAEQEIAIKEYSSIPEEMAHVPSPRELAIYKAKLAKAEANRKFTVAELSMTTIKAPFDGIVGSLQKKVGSTVQEGEVFTTLSDSSQPGSTGCNSLPITATSPSAPTFRTPTSCCVLARLARCCSIRR
jgi:membrane fusion protein (multidrug efflux system)